MSRAKNTATVQDVARLLRAEGTTLETSKFLHADIEVVVSNYERFMVQYLKFTPRPVESVLKAAAADVYETADPGEVLLFAQRLQAAFAYCKQKAGQMSSGKKLHASVFKVCQGFEAWKPKVSGVAARVPAKFPEGGSSSSSSKGPSNPDLEHPVRSPSPRRVTDKRRMRAVISPSLAPASPDRVKRLRTVLEGAFGRMPSSSGSAIDLDSPVSSKGLICIEDSPAASAEQGKGIEYLDSCKLCLVRLLPSGQLLEAAMKPGPQGFALAFFPDDNGKAIETELPNLMLTAKAQTVMKKPAGRGGKSSNISSAEVESGEAVAAESMPGSPELVSLGAEACKLETNDEEDAEEEEATEDEEVEVPPAQEALVQPPPDPKEQAEPVNTEGLFKGSSLVVIYATMQSYIQEKLPTGKKRLVVAVAKSQSENHQAVIKTILEILKEKPLFDKALALRLRSEALSQ